MTAYGRRATDLDPWKGRNRIVQGTLDDAEGIAKAIEGTDAVVVAFGPRKGGPQIFCAHATQLIISVMKRRK